MIRTWGIVALLTLALAGSAGAYHPHSSCVSAESVHGYTMSNGAIAAVGFTSAGAFGAGYKAVVVDGCDPFDGEYEFGVGGGAFPAGPWVPCIGPAAVAHHSSGVGAAYGVIEFASGDVAFVAGTDGMEVGPCLTNGVITSDPVLDPYDCVGNVGVATAMFHGTASGLAPNTPLADCHGGDGFVWVFLLQGAIVEDCGVFGVVTSSPVSGHIVESNAWGWCQPLFIDP